MALVFYNTPQAPVECALEISQRGQGTSGPQAADGDSQRTGQFSGIMSIGGSNIAGAGINIAQRVMDYSGTPVVFTFPGIWLKIWNSTVTGSGTCMIWASAK